MAHFAQIDSGSGAVVRVVVIANGAIADSGGQESESLGIEFCQMLYGPDTHWRQTSYSARMRKNYAGIGYTYDSGRDAFIPPKPYPSWQLDEGTCRWLPPVPAPVDGGPWAWDEAGQSWQLLQ